MRFETMLSQCFLATNNTNELQWDKILYRYNLNTIQRFTLYCAYPFEV